jgi:hypothetical protein
MPLKPKNPQTHSEPPRLKDELSGPWGRISSDPHAVAALRLCKKAPQSSEESYSYPYRVLSFWHWRGGKTEEELQIEAGSDLVLVKGRGLDRLVEALDRGVLEILREPFENNPTTDEESILVSAILIQKLSSDEKQ